MRLNISVLAGLVLLTGAAAAGAQSDSSDDQYKSYRVRVTLTDRTQLDGLSAAVQKAQSDSKEPAVITDMMLDLTRTDKKIEDALRAADGEIIPGYSDVAFTAEFTAVAGGKLYSEAGAACSAFSNDIASCHIDCDGGGFKLQRKAVAEGFALTLIAGKDPASRDDGRDEFVIGDCGESDALLVGVKTLGTQSNVDFASKY